VEVPGDKSISHRVILLGALARGTTRARRVLLADDCRRTMAAVRALGIRVRVPSRARGSGTVLIQSRGAEAWRQPAGPIDCGNSGTTMRLLAGALAARPIRATLIGDASLTSRPMRRVARPLKMMGARVRGRVRHGELYPPLQMAGGARRPIRYPMPVASAQVKSAVLLAGVQLRGTTMVREPVPTRDHTERLLQACGVRVRQRGGWVAVQGPAALRPQRVIVPGDLSSAAVLIIAALLVPGSHLVLRDVGLNPTRAGVLTVLRRMGARVRSRRRAARGWEPRGDVEVSASVLHGVAVGGALIANLIDELPILMVATCAARGRTTFCGVGELRVKETDRIAAMVTGLSRMGAAIRARRTRSGDVVEVRGGRSLQGAVVESRGDHRTAMSLAVAGLIASGTTRVRDVACVETSFPGFASALRAAGVSISG